MMGYGWDFGGGWLMMGGGLIALVAIIVVIVWAISRPAQQPWMGPTRREPLDILRERYARGELSEEQFAQAKRTLGYEQ